MVLSKALLHSLPQVLMSHTPMLGLCISDLCIWPGTTPQCY